MIVQAEVYNLKAFYCQCVGEPQSSLFPILLEEHSEEEGDNIKYCKLLPIVYLHCP